MTFSYPTVGIPVPGQEYNTTLIKKEDFPAFDSEINNLLKPYNVLMLIIIGHRLRL